MVNNSAEAIGYLCVVGFLYLLWPPAALLGTGVLLIIWANARAVRGARTSASLGAAWGAARAAYRAHRLNAELTAPADLRRVA
jgi:hypothetical protein